MNAWTSYFLAGIDYFNMVSSFEGSIQSCWPLLPCFRNMVSWTSNLRFSRLTPSRCSTHCCIIFSTIARCSLSVLPLQMGISSRYQLHRSICLNIVSIISWNYVGTLVRPLGITAYTKCPCLVPKVIFHSSYAAIPMKLYPFLRSNRINHFLTHALSRNIRMSGSGYMLGIIPHCKDL